MSSSVDDSFTQVARKAKKDTPAPQDVLLLLPCEWDWPMKNNKPFTLPATVLNRSDVPDADTTDKLAASKQMGEWFHVYDLASKMITVTRVDGTHMQFPATLAYREALIDSLLAMRQKKETALAEYMQSQVVKLGRGNR